MCAASFSRCSEMAGKLTPASNNLVFWGKEKKTKTKTADDSHPFTFCSFFPWHLLQNDIVCVMFSRLTILSQVEIATKVKIEQFFVDEIVKKSSTVERTYAENSSSNAKRFSFPRIVQSQSLVSTVI